MNSVCLVGNLTRDVEMKYLQSGTPLANFSIAVNRRIKKGEEWINKAVFVECVIFGKPAEWLAEGGAKGAKVIVQGELDMDQWEKDGKKHSKLTVLCNEAQLAERRQTGGGSSPQRQEEPRRSAPPPGDDIPFAWLIGFITIGSQLPWIM